MKDLQNQELRLGDKVAVSRQRGYAGLQLAEVFGFTPKKVRVVIWAYRKSPNAHDYSELRDSDQIVILERNPEREEELKTTTPSI